MAPPSTHRKNSGDESVHDHLFHKVKDHLYYICSLDKNLLTLEQKREIYLRALKDGNSNCAKYKDDLYNNIISHAKYFTHQHKDKSH